MQAGRGGEGEKRSAYNGDADDLFRSLSRKEEKGRPDHRCEVMRARYWPGQSLAVDFFFSNSRLYSHSDFPFLFCFVFSFADITRGPGEGGGRAEREVRQMASKCLLQRRLQRVPARVPLRQ